MPHRLRPVQEAAHDRSTGVVEQAAQIPEGVEDAARDAEIEIDHSADPVDGRVVQGGDGSLADSEQVSGQPGESAQQLAGKGLEQVPHQVEPDLDGVADEVPGGREDALDVVPRRRPVAVDEVEHQLDDAGDDVDNGLDRVANLVEGRAHHGENGVAPN